MDGQKTTHELMWRGEPHASGLRDLAALPVGKFFAPDFLCEFVRRLISPAGGPVPSDQMERWRTVYVHTLVASTMEVVQAKKPHAAKDEVIRYLEAVNGVQFDKVPGWEEAKLGDDVIRATMHADLRFAVQRAQKHKNILMQVATKRVMSWLDQAGKRLRWFENIFLYHHPTDATGTVFAPILCVSVVG